MKKNEKEISKGTSYLLVPLPMYTRNFKFDYFLLLTPSNLTQFLRPLTTAPYLQRHFDLFPIGCRHYPQNSSHIVLQPSQSKVDNRRNGRTVTHAAREDQSTIVKVPKRPPRSKDIRQGGREGKERKKNVAASTCRRVGLLGVGGRKRRISESKRQQR